jgi:16S rRNA processing protein RimM
VTAAADDPSRADARSRAVSAGRVGRAHGLDGSFYVTGARPRLLSLGSTLRVEGRSAKLVRRAGTDEHPIVRLEGIDGRAQVQAIRGVELTVDLAEAPRLGEGEWWASELEGCEVFDGERRIGVVARLVELPSCEALEVRLAAGEPARLPSRVGDVLVPMVRDAIRHVDPLSRRIDVDMSFLGELP